MKQDIEILLPWYVTGQLSKEEHQRVDQYLQSHPEMANQLDLVREENDETIFANEALGAPSPRVFDKLMREIQAEEAARPVPLLDRLTSWLPKMEPGGFQLAGIAAAVVIVAQAAIIGALLTNEPSGSGFETATGPGTEQVTATPDLLISFNETTTAVQISDVLEEFGLEIIGGPKPGGLYEVRLLEPAKSEEEKEKLVEKLQNKGDLIQFVSVTE